MRNHLWIVEERLNNDWIGFHDCCRLTRQQARRLQGMLRTCAPDEPTRIRKYVRVEPVRKAKPKPIVQVETPIGIGSRVKLSMWALAYSRNHMLDSPEGSRERDAWTVAYQREQAERGTVYNDLGVNCWQIAWDDGSSTNTKKDQVELATE